MSTTLTAHTTVRPSAVQQPTSYNYISTLDILKPQVLDQYVNNYGAEDFTGWMEFLGGAAEVENGGQDFIHYETPGRLEQFVLAGTIADGSGVDAALVTLDAASLVGGKSAARVGQTVEFKDGTEGYISAKPADNQINIKPYVNGVDLASFITAGDPIYLRWMEVAEGSDTVDTLTPQPGKYTGNLIFLREDYKITDAAASAISWVPVEMSNGTTGYYWYYEGENRTYRRYKNAIDFQKLYGRKITNTELTGLGLKGAKGLLPAIKSGGNSIAYTALDITVFDVATQVIDKEGGSTESAWVCDILQAQESDKWMHDYNANGGIVWGDFSATEEVKIQLGFTSFKYSEHTFHRKNYRGFNKDAVFGYSTASDATKNYGIIMPLDFKDDAKRAGVKVPSMRVRFAPVFGDRMRHWTTGGGSVNKTDSKAELRFHYQVNEGLEVFGINRFIELGKNL